MPLLTKIDQDKAVTAQFRIGKTALEIKESCEHTEGLEDMPLSRIYTLKRKFEQSKTDDLVPELADLPLNIVQEVVTETKQRVMLSDSQEKGALLGALSDVLDAKKGLEHLSMAFQNTMTNALRVFDKHLTNPELPLKDVKMITDCVAKAHTDIFSSTTNIHIGDNNTDNKKQSIFQSEMRS